MINLCGMSRVGTPRPNLVPDQSRGFESQGFETEHTNDDGDGDDIFTHFQHLHFLAMLHLTD